MAILLQHMYNENMCVLHILIAIFLLNRPVFSQNHSTLKYEVDEELDINTIIGDIIQDGNLLDLYGISEGDYSRLEFTLYPMSPDHHGLLSINRNTGILQIVSRMDHEEICPYKEVCKIVSDIGVVDLTVGGFTALGLEVNLWDINDNPPEFLDVKMPFDITVSESSPIGSIWPLPVAMDIDFGINNVQRYAINDSSGLFYIDGVRDENRGVFIECQLRLLGDLDREFQDNYQIQMVASDEGDPIRSAVLNINVAISDSNDHTPIFAERMIELNISEATEVDTVLYTLQAHDKDLGVNGQVTYALGQSSSTSFGSLFMINSLSGELKLKSRLNFDRRSWYELQIVARDQGAHSRAGYATVTIGIINVNDHAPVMTINGQPSTACPAELLGMLPDNSDIQCLSAYVAENNIANSFVASFTVDDGDGDHIICVITPSPVSITNSHSTDNHIITIQEIRSTSGSGLYTLSAGISFDREVLDQYSVMVRCTDTGDPTLSSRTHINIQVTDTNDHRPVLEATELYAFVTENNTPGTILEARLYATDLDVRENGRITYLINDTVSWIEVNSSSGELTLTAPLDYEDATSHVVRLAASDNGDPPLAATAFLYISVTDTNDEVPLFNEDVYTFSIPENAEVGSIVGAVSAYDCDSTLDFTTIEYFLTSTSENYFSIDRETGIIRTLKVLDRERRAEYTLLLGARNPGEHFGLSSTATVKVNITDINDNAPYITYPSASDNILEIPKRVPHGYTFAHVTAVDPDEGENSRLGFELELTPTTLALYPDARKLFEIDHDLGLIFITRDLEVYQHTIFVLFITVRDHGEYKGSDWRINLKYI